MSEDNKTFSCANCAVYACQKAEEEKYPGFCPTKNVDRELLAEAVKEYTEDEQNYKMFRVSAKLEAEFYMKYTRVQETITFIERMGFQKVGIATCVGLLPEARIFSKLLAAHNIEHYVCGCKIGAVDKGEVGIPEEDRLYQNACEHESMCNPIMQAKELARIGTDFNVVMGLCVGHDSLFLKYSEAPTTVMIVKDRVLGNNPVQALYMAYSTTSRFKKELGIPGKDPNEA